MAISWSSIAVIWRLDDNGELEFLVQDIEFTGKFAWQAPQLRFVGGTNKSHPSDESPLGTLHRKVRDETRLEIREGPELREVHTSVSGEHKKHFFLVPFVRMSGQLRADTIDGRNCVMRPPRWVKARGARVYRTHKQAARKAVKELMGDSTLHS